MSIPTLYTVQEAAKLLKVSQRSIYNYLDSGKLKASKNPRTLKWLIPESSILAFLGMAEEPADAFNENTLEVAQKAIGEEETQTGDAISHMAAIRR